MKAIANAARTIGITFSSMDLRRPVLPSAQPEPAELVIVPDRASQGFERREARDLDLNRNKSK
jgi:hypothetical protein